MFDDIVQQFLGSGAASEAVQALTRDHRLPEQQAQQAVRATAEATGEVVKRKGFDLGKLLGGLGGVGGIAGSLGLGGQKPSAAGGLPPELVGSISDLVVQRTNLSKDVASSVVSVVLPKVLEFAKRASPVG